MNAEESQNLKSQNSKQQLVDSFGRVHTALRLSVTDRCNIRCFYCMPSEQVQFLPRPEILTFEELTQATRAFVKLGINKIRLTGGEPLVRKDLPKLVQMLKEINGIDEIAMTTNAILLAKQAAVLKDAGLDRINVSLDTLDKKQFEAITRRDNLDDALQGIAAAKEAGFADDLRINAVAVKGLIEEQVVPLVRFAMQNELKMRFIEFMPLNSTGKWTEEEVLTGKKIRQLVERELGPLIAIPRKDPSQPAVDFGFEEGRPVVGFVNSVSEPFCGDCNRLRLTAEGKIRNCLFSHEEWDLRALLRNDATTKDVESLIVDCVANKKASHGIGTDEFQKPQRAMYQIGG